MSYLDNEGDCRIEKLEKNMKNNKLYVSSLADLSGAHGSSTHAGTHQFLSTCGNIMCAQFGGVFSSAEARSHKRLVFGGTSPAGLMMLDVGRVCSWPI